MRKHTVSYIFGALAALVLITILGWRYYARLIEKNELNGLIHTTEYERHYALIPDDTSATLWQDIYKSASETAAGNGAYVELLGDWAAGNYTPAEYVDIAIAANMDGIILKPDGTANMRKAIDKAEQSGIPVITVLDDETASGRRSFVGINSYQLGTVYGKQILECMDENTRKVTVLLNSGDAGKDLIFKQLKTTVQDGLRPGKSDVQIETLTIHSGSTFDADEVIRDLLNKEETRPDILVCMNETDSECAYHAMVDYNQVGTVNIIGYYQSETILNAISKGTIPMTITLDSGQVGRYSVEALEEYYSMGYVSSYFSVDLSIITRENVGQFLKEDVDTNL